MTPPFHGMSNAQPEDSNGQFLQQPQRSSTASVSSSVSLWGTITSEARVSGTTSPGKCRMLFHFPDSDCNRLTNAAPDTFGRIPEYKVCTCRIEEIPESEAYTKSGASINQKLAAPQRSQQLRKKIESIIQS